MMKTMLAGAILLSGAMSAAAQTPAPAATPAPPPANPAPYGAPITFDQAKKAIDAAEAEARKNNWNVAIAVVDSGGALVYLRRLDNVQIGSIRIAEGKAASAVHFRRPTKALEDSLQQTTRILAVEGIMPLEGGIPIVLDGKIVGGIGVSGVTSAQDAMIANAGFAALK